MTGFAFPKLATALAATLLLFGAVCPPADAGVRTRTLPDLPDGVESSLTDRLGAADRIHALVEIPRGRRSLAEADGIRLLRPVGGRLWLASVPCGLVSAPAFARASFRLWDLRPADRVAPGLADHLAALPVGERVNLRVKVFRDEPTESVVRAVRALGGRLIREIPKLGIVDVAVDRGRLDDLAARDDVRWIEAPPGVPEGAANDMRVDAEVNGVQTAGLNGTGVVIGIWDTGQVDTSHPDFGTRVTVGETGLALSPHSTHVAGIALGDGANSSNQGGGGLQWRGVATAATGVNYDFINEIVEIDSAITLFDIDVSQNSWVYPVSQAAGNCSLYGDYASEAPEFDQIVNGIYGKAVPVVFAAGNERDDGDCTLPLTGGFGTLPPPGTAKNVITVGAHQSDAGHMTPFSSWGPTDDGRMKPDMTAPGCQISGDQGITSASLGGVYLSMCGTSMAAPVISGSIAVLLQEWEARFTGAPRPATHKALLGCFAKDRAKAGPDYRFGLGAVNLQASVDELQTGTTIEDSVADTLTDLWTFTVPAGAETLVVTLAWDDPVAAELASPTLINDLDLELVAPTAGTFQAFVLDPANPDSVATTGANRLDNLEQVRVLTPEAGTWTARVIGFSVPQGPQDYSLVGFDGRPPADPASATATAAGDTTVSLSWIRPGDVDRAGTIAVRSLAPVTWVPADGTFYTVGAQPTPGVTVVAADDVDYSGTPLADEPLAPGTVYHYAFFSHDEIPNYSAGVADTAMTTSVAVDAPLVAGVESVAVPRFALQGAHPFRDVGTFRFELPRTAVVSLDVFDTAGRRVTTILAGERKAGSHPVRWATRDRSGARLAAGVYFVRFRTESVTMTEKIVIVR